MSSYWKNEEKIKVSQTQVSIPSTNGQSYSMTAGQGTRRVDFEIPPSVKFMDGKNTYLSFNVKIGLNGQNKTRLTLDPFIGGNAIIKNFRCYANTANRPLLEEITEYNAKVQIQYSYDQDDSKRKMRALKEGSLVPTIKNRGTLGTSVSNNIDLSTNPYFQPVIADPTADWSDADFVTAKITLPIHAGLFSGNSVVFPCMLTNGLLCELDLEDPARYIKQLDSVNRNRRMQQNPVFNGVGTVGTDLAINNASNHTEIFLERSNNVKSVETCPFVRGELIGICSKTDVNSEAALTTTAVGDQAYLTITDITTEVSGGVSYVKLTCGEFQNSNTGNGVIVTSGNFIVFSAAVDQFRTQNDDNTTQLIAKKTSFPVKVDISNMELVVQQVTVDPRYESGMMSKIRSGGAIEIDIPSVTNYKHSLLSSNRNATVSLDVSNTRAKSAIIMPSDATVLDSADLIGGLRACYEEEVTAMDGRLHSIRSGQVGIIDRLTSWQMVIDDVVTPSQPCVVSKINKGVSIAAQPLVFLEQALRQAGIEPTSFVDYNRNFLIGKAYALNNGVANLNNKSNQLQLLYNERNAAGVDLPPSHNKLLYCYVFHLRRITIKGNSVVVTL
jgi:hypothetical protein